MRSGLAVVESGFSRTTSRSAPRRVSRAASLVVVSSLLLVAWGAFAFGAVYSWAYTPLVIVSALIGLLGIVTGTRPVWSRNRMLVAALAAVALIGAVQLVPLSLPTLGTISPATIDFLRHYDFRYTVDPDAIGPTAADLRHPISVAPASTTLFLWLYSGPLLLFAGLMRTLSRTATLRLARGIVFVGTLLAIVALVQKALLGDNAYNGMKIYGFWQPEYLLTTPYGPFVNKNHFAGWMLMAVPLALGLCVAQAARTLDRPLGSIRAWIVWFSEPEGGRVLLYFVSAIIMTLSLLMAGSRSGLGCFAVTLCAASAWVMRRRSRRAAVAAIAAVLVLVVGGLQWAGSDAALQRFANDPNSLAMRLDIWRLSASIVRRFPLLGTGMNTFGTATLVYQPPAESHYSEAHNDYLQLLVEGGAVTFALVLVAIAAAAMAIRSRFRADDDGPEARWVRVGATTGLVAIALQSLVEFSLQMPGNATLFAVLLALALYVPAPLADRRGPRL